ncbi:unnamed protein product [Rhizophagus irregularis]|nr:unnamed protein product [Rhizophagus irregularis]
MQSLFVYLFVLGDLFDSYLNRIQIQKEKTSASGYIFDFNPNSISNENIDILRIWPDDNAIYDAIKTAYNDAAGFIKALGIKLLNDKTIPHFYVSTSHQSMVISDLSKNCNDDFDIDNISGLDFNNEEFELDNLNENSFTDAASEVARLSKLVDLTESELKQISDISDSSKVELNHILNTTKFSSLIEFQQNELFYTNDGTSEPTIRSRKERWTGRKNLENIGLPQYINVPNISRANVTDNNPLRENGFILYISKEIATFVNTDGNLFSQICKSGGNIFAHITPKQVIYHFDNSCLDINNVASLPGRLCLEGNSWEIFNFFSQKHVINVIATIFG